MVRHSRMSLLLATALLLVPVPSEAWGFEAHRFIMERALPLLPPQLRPFFEAARATVIERSVDPDLWRTAGWEAEAPRHFVDLDAYGPHPFRGVPRDFDEAVRKHGREFVEQNGTLPWRTEELYRQLVEAFGQKTPYARDNIRVLSSWVAHYVSDAHVPLHSALNYDGQLTGQVGIHSRFESELFERYRVRLRITPRPVALIKAPREAMFETLTESYPHVQPILEADRWAVTNRDLYDDGYFGMFFGRVRPILEKRLSDSITAVASMITSAWTEAGSPALPLQVQRPAKTVRRQ
jgi:hypothetical protein